MSVRISKLPRYFLVSAMTLTAWAACSGKKVAPLPAVPPVPPGYVMVPHPEGMDIGDLMAIFTDKQAPSPEEMRTCDTDFQKLRKLTASRQELQQGAREFVRNDPVKYHWCFYGKLLQLEEKLGEENFYIQERQRAVLDAYVFITPFSRAFLVEFQDSRYLRWAISRYRKLSETVFYRRLDLSPELTSELAIASNPFGLQRPREETRGGILHKYGLLVPEDPIPMPSTGAPTAMLPLQGAENGIAPPPIPSGVPLPAPVATATVIDTAPPAPPVETAKATPSGIPMPGGGEAPSMVQEPAARAPASVMESTPATSAPPTAPAAPAAPAAPVAPATAPAVPAAEAPAAAGAPMAPPADPPPIEAVLDGNNVNTVTQ